MSAWAQYTVAYVALGAMVVAVVDPIDAVPWERALGIVLWPLLLVWCFVEAAVKWEAEVDDA